MNSFNVVLKYHAIKRTRHRSAGNSRFKGQESAPGAFRLVFSNIKQSFKSLLSDFILLAHCNGEFRWRLVLQTGSENA